MPITSRAGRLKLGLALRRRGAIPVLRVDIVRNDAISQRAHHTADTATSLEVWRPHVGWLLAENIDECLLELGHLRREL